jgi:hypothetical protein
MLGQMPERGADRRPGGVDPGDHQQDHRAADMASAQLGAADLGLQQERGDVVARVGDMVGDLRVDAPRFRVRREPARPGTPGSMN